MKTETITMDEFDERFKPMINPFEDPTSGIDHLETFGEQLAHVEAIAKVNPDRVWTYIEAENDFDVVYASGFHYVNRIGYVITEIPCPKDTFIEAIDKDVFGDE